ncbi:MAG: Type 1 glutamine amidotransferase-like domain-containing protein [Eubacteriales bacterium]|nr:Type 1 glutamine amidotransferase-like domain-containing protein [Eubacteriales bacterium]
MYAMFAECGLPFEQYHVIDHRMEASAAVGLVGEASCIFLMGGYPRLQWELMRDTGVNAAIRNAGAAVLGVSAGAINMAKRSLDTKESLVPYEGLGLADITVKPHFEPENRTVLAALLQISQELPICAMEDDSAIFVAGKTVSHTGQIHWIDKGKVCPLWQSPLPTQS